MRVLIVKLSSMGDVLHTFPALTECLAYFPQLKIDWVVEPAFKEMVQWHPGVHHIYSFPLRAAKKNKRLFFSAIPKVIKEIRKQKYDLVIDAQGLIKSALLAKCLKAKRIVGLDKFSAREPFASKFYHQGYNIPWSLHAVVRLKQLFSDIFGYPLSEQVDYGIAKETLIKSQRIALDYLNKPFMVLLHGTTWQTKHWPESYWEELIQSLTLKRPDITILLPWGSASELERANRLAASIPKVEVLPKLSIIELAYYLAQAESVVAVDTGLGHLAAALGTKTINLYGATDPNRTGTVGLNQIHLAVSKVDSRAYSCAPCLKRECIYANNKQNSVHPPCYQIINPNKVMENLLT